MMQTSPILAVFLALALATTVLAKSTERGMQVSVIEHPQKPDVKKKEQRYERIKALLHGLSANTLFLVGDTYDPAIEFEDPLGQVKGINDLRTYYEKLYKSVKELRFVITAHYNEGPTFIVVWTMHVTSESLNKGEQFSVPGTSIFTFNEQNDRIAYHRDYFDMGALVYENLPIVGRVIEGIKDRVSPRQNSGGKK